VSAIKDLTGQVFGRLTVLRRVGSDKYGNAIWLCRCACDGKEVPVARGRLGKNSNSCGCIRRELLSERHKDPNFHPNLKHGYASTRTRGRLPEYEIWSAMVQRCTNPKCRAWNYYGGANPPVLLHESWHDFSNFLADMGERPSPRHTLGRFGDVGNYEPGNCAWQTWKEQRAEARKKRFAAVLAA
jgi:hypothetical protein